MVTKSKTSSKPAKTKSKRQSSASIVSDSVPRRLGRPRWQVVLRRYPLVLFALVLGLGLIGISLGLAHHANQASAGLDLGAVLPVSMPSKTPSTVYTAESIKQYDGQNGRACYVAVKGTVYEIKGNAYWQGGKHLPSNGQAYCGADLSGVIGKSPHGESVLSGLPKVGIFK